MLGAVVVISVCAVALVQLIVDKSRDAYLADVSAGLTSRAKQRTAQSRQNFQVVARDVLVLAQLPVVQNLVDAFRGGSYAPAGNDPVQFWSAQLERIFSTFAKANPTYFQIRYIGLAGNGRELVRIDSKDGQPTIVPAEQLQSKGDRDYFQAAVKLKAGQLYVSDIDLNQERGEIQVPHVRTWRAATPVFTSGGDLSGIIVINVDVGSAIDALSANHVPGVLSYLANSNGDYLMHPDPSRTFGFDLGRRYTLQQDMPDLKLPPSGAELTTQRGSHRNGILHLTAGRIEFDPQEPEHFLTLVYALPDDLVEAHISGVRKTTAAAVGGFALLLLGLTVLATRWAFAPLTRLTALAERIGAGQYDVALPAEGVGELGSLVRAFRNMLNGIGAREREIQGALTRARALLESAPDPVVIVDAEGRIAVVNARAEAAFGYARAELLGQPVEMLIPQRLHAAHVAQRAPYQESPSPRVMGAGRELLGLRKDGSEFAVDVSLSPLVTPEGTLIISTVRDVTERMQARQALQKSEAFVRATMDALQANICVLNEAGTIVALNQGWRVFAAANGADPDKVGEGTNYLAVCAAATGAERATAEGIAEGIRGVAFGVKERFDVEYPCHSPGQQRWFRASVNSFRVAGTVHVVLSHFDITERVLAEKRLQQQKERAEALLESAPDPVVIVNPEGRIVLVNGRAKTVFGYARMEMVGQPVELLIPERLHAAHVAQRVPYQDHPRVRAMGAGRALYARRKDGSEFAVDIRLSPLETPEGTLIISTVRDVTERKRAEQRIRTQLEHLRLLDQITRATGERQDLKSIFGVVVRSLEDSLPIDFGCVCLHDATANALTVISVGVNSRALARELTMDPGASIDLDANGLSRCVHGQLTYEPDIGESEFPFPQRLVRGGLRSVVMAPLKAESRVFGVLVVARREANAFSSVECEFLRQLSEHVALAAYQAQLHESLQQAYDDLRQTQAAAMQEERLRALGQMASGIAHDINNALSPVSLYVESLLETEKNLSERARGYLETIGRSVDDVAQTVARMREFYRQREAQIELVPVDANQMVQQVLDLTKAHWSDMALKGGITIRAVSELAPDLPRIMGVESEIREALTNLVFNAVDAMPEGGTLTLRTRTAGTAAEPSVIVEVVDSGVGMDEETRKRCLEPFFTTKGERGTGLGLAMVFGMVQRHGAGIEIDSAPGAGTTMRLVFAVPTAVIAEPGQAVAAPAAPQRLRLLLVDDDPVLLNSLRYALEIDGHVVVATNSGQAGIAESRASLDRGEPYAAVITDLGMPYVDGRKVAAAVKEASPTTPVILLTGWGQRLIAEGDVPPHVDRVLAKPPKLRELREALAQLCRGAQA